MKTSVHDVLLGLEQQSKGSSRLHQRHPAALLLAVLVWLVILSSFHRHSLFILVPYSLMLYNWFLESKIDRSLILQGLWKLEPFIIAIALLNPLLEKGSVQWLGYTLPAGLLTAVSIFVKGNMTILITLSLMATIGIRGLAEALSTLKVPKVVIDTTLMTYRYLLGLTEEVQTRWRAYQLRAPYAKGIELRAAGSFVGQLLVRSLERGERIHQAMALRGSTELPPYLPGKLHKNDLKFMITWMSFSFIIKVLSLWI